MVGSEKNMFYETVRNGRSRSSKVVDFGNRKRACNFLLVINGNISPTLHRFRDIAGFLLKQPAHPYFAVNLGMFRKIADVEYCTAIICNGNEC